MTSSGRRNLRIARLPAAVESLRLPPSLPPRDLAYAPYTTSPLTPESPAAVSPSSIFTPPTTPHDFSGGNIPPVSRAPAAPISNSTNTNPPPHHHTFLRNAGATAHLVAPPQPPPIDPTSLASENKRAQNRRSAKRFREAQKIRWKALQDENALLRGEVERLTCLLARSAVSDDEPVATHQRSDLRASAISISALLCPSSSGPASTPNLSGDDTRITSAPHQCSGSNTHSPHPSDAAYNPNHHAALLPTPYPGSHGGSSCTFNPYPPSPADPAFSLEAEASLYAQILLAPSPRQPGLPYTTELGVLLRCICARSGVVLRGEPFPKDVPQAGPFALTAGLSPANATALKHAISSSTPVALMYTRNGVLVNAVVGASEDGGAGVIAEFTPVNSLQ